MVLKIGGGTAVIITSPPAPPLYEPTNHHYKVQTQYDGVLSLPYGGPQKPPPIFVYRTNITVF